jgi:hypothetical protein
MQKLLVIVSAFAVLLVVSTEALARSPAIYNARGEEVGVLKGAMQDGSVIMQPNAETIGTGGYNVAIAPEDLKPRGRGGWVTSLTNQEIAYMDPVTRGQPLLHSQAMPGRHRVPPE